MLPRVRIEHEIDQRALELRSEAPVHGKPRAGDFSGALEIQNPQIGTEFPVGLRSEIELAGLAAAPDLDIFLRATTHRNRFVRQVRNPGQQILMLLVERADLLIERGYLVAQRAQGLLFLCGIDTLFAQPGDLSAFIVTTRFQFFRFVNHGAAARIQILESIERRRIRTGRQARCNFVEMGPEKPEIVHFPMLTQPGHFEAP